MAYDEDLADRIRELLEGEQNVSEQKMFGGLSFLIGGHLAVAASGKGGVLVRVDPAESDRLVDTTSATLMDMGGPHDAGLAARRRGQRAHEAPTRSMGRAGDDVRPLASRQEAREAIVGRRSHHGPNFT
jgi:hypothetical protein